MDIERFAPNAGSTIPSVIANLPPTVELTGFSDQRHYLEQHAIFTRQHRRTTTNGEFDCPSLDSHCGH
ncbi:hypothetical protein [Photobacterium sp. J15]|uniref:hypothetical protein n=1 Tax=Photobacterium sp. J15 TaxID=265901 RepID=UPI0007E3EF78|nr:hypothetical protein [Photobacterium sp. J15]